MFKIIFILLIFQTVSVIGQNRNEQYINTASGKLSIEKLQFSLTHEHLMSNFGAPASVVSVYDSATLCKQVIPYLKKLKLLGVSSIFDCTAAYFGRNVSLLKILSDRSGIQIITNTGFYGAAKDAYIPAFAFSETVEKIAKIWITEFEKGIDNTEIKPGFIKLAFDDGDPSPIDTKLFEAGILTHLATGLTLVVHTGNNVLAAKKQLSLLDEKKVSPSAWVWAHANKLNELPILIEAANKGAWISLDGVNDSNIDTYIKTLAIFRKEKLLHKILLSHDGNSFPRGGDIRRYDAIACRLIPDLLLHGFTSQDIHQIMVINPKEAFSIRTRNSK